ncbi:DUF1304 domain-containing protein [Niabella sp. CC-SYL272]|uniref:DUF1304 domain-containing protein n=1 Tax=Niabella agricola TaxID=2891571 RepID=UPI001F229227|nr:DUF1304 domain-containing protein [Niabella agricola]MCF3110240.1 DUF1304 domain-containing protein [Niabella agricola]
MSTIAYIFVALVAAEHLVILYIEMFAWETAGKKVFKTLPPELFKPTRSMAANQGLYNGFLAAGLLWSLFISDPVWQQHIALFFLGCVIVAGSYGAISASKKIFFIQALPAVLGFLFVYLSRYYR